MKRVIVTLLSLLTTCTFARAAETDCVHWRAVENGQSTTSKVMQGILNVTRWFEPGYAVAAGVAAVANRDSYQAKDTKPMCENPDTETPLTEEEMAAVEDEE